MFGKMIGGGKSKSTDDIGNDTETIIPTIEITEYGSPLTPVLMEYEMIRMGRDAERTLSQLLVKAGSKSKIPICLCLLNHAKYAFSVVSFKMVKYCYLILRF